MKSFVMILMLSTATFAAWQDAGDAHYKIDQFGYLPNESKVCVISSAQKGFNTPDVFSPGTTLQVKSWPGNQIVFSGTPTAWKNGAIDTIAGDKGWWFDFSSVTTPGEYIIFDEQKNLRSHPFRIGTNIYDQVLVQAMRTYYYQREAFEKKAPFADPRWVDGASHLNDTVARSVFDKTNAATARNMSGGWMDAGDQNKYITFLDDVISQMLYAYQKSPLAFTDSTNIPESKNGIPDILDEIQFEVQWMLKMQDTDGGVFIKVGCDNTNDPSPPSSDTRPRYYGKKCSSAAISFAAILAHVAYVYKDVPGLSAKAPALLVAAENAWTWFLAQTVLESWCDNGEVKSGDADRTGEQQKSAAARGAMWLWAATGKQVYHDYFKANYAKIDGVKMGWWGPYLMTNDDAAMFYTTMPGADATIKAAILASIATQDAANATYYGFKDTLALYRAFMPIEAFHWGSNMARASAGNINLRMIDFNVNTTNKAGYLKRALQYVHWFHGVNALGKVYLSTMYAWGAENSVDAFFHTWFASGTVWDNARTSPKGPAPGFLVGGPNNTYGKQGWEPPEAKLNIPPYDQPGEKSYKDFNEGWPGVSYAVTENAIYYQASYVRLLAGIIQSVKSTASSVRYNGAMVQGAYQAGQSGITLFRLDGRVVGGAGSALNIKDRSAALPAGIYLVQRREGGHVPIVKLLIP